MKGVTKQYWTTFEWDFYGRPKPDDYMTNYQVRCKYDEYLSKHEEIVETKIFNKAKEIANKNDELYFSDSLGLPAWGYVMSFISLNSNLVDDAIAELYAYVKRFKYIQIVGDDV